MDIYFWKSCTWGILHGVFDSDLMYYSAYCLCVFWEQNCSDNVIKYLSDFSIWILFPEIFNFTVHRLLCLLYRAPGCFGLSLSQQKKIEIP